MWMAGPCPMWTPSSSADASWSPPLQRGGRRRDRRGRLRLLLRRGWRVRARCGRHPPRQMLPGLHLWSEEGGDVIDVDASACSSDVDGLSVPDVDAILLGRCFLVSTLAAWRAATRSTWTPPPAPPTWMAGPCPMWTPSSSADASWSPPLQRGGRRRDRRGRLRLLLRRGW